MDRLSTSVSTGYSQPAAQMLAGVNWYALAVVCGLLVFALAYAFLVVRPLRRRDPDHHHTAWLVAVGDAAIVVAYTLLTDLTAGALLLALMVVAGIPMIWEYIDDVSREKLEL